MSKYQEALDEIGMQVNKAYIDSCYEKATKQSMRKVEDIVGVNIKILQELVDKATPKKTIKRGRGCCPNCGENLLGGHDLGQEWIKHCFNCGQKLDWSEDDE